jgi:hypothetical protein
MVSGVVGDLLDVAGRTVDEVFIVIRQAIQDRFGVAAKWAWLQFRSASIRARK